MKLVMLCTDVHTWPNLQQVSFEKENYSVVDSAGELRRSKSEFTLDIVDKREFNTFRPGEAVTVLIYHGLGVEVDSDG